MIIFLIALVLGITLNELFRYLYFSYKIYKLRDAPQTLANKSVGFVNGKNRLASQEDYTTKKGLNND